MLLLSVPGKAYLAVCSVVLVAYLKLEARALIGEWQKSIIGYGRVVPWVIGHLLLRLE